MSAAMQHRTYTRSVWLLIILLFNQAFAQSGISKSVGLLAGAGVSRVPYLELGLSKNQMAYGGVHAAGSAFYASGEVHLGAQPVVGVKAGGWISLLPFVLGLSAARYTSFREGSWVAKPEAGLGIDRFKVTYCWNIRLTNKTFDGIRAHSIGLAYCFRLKKIKEQHGN